MATIDRLDIQIEGSAQKANVAINDLIKNLGRLANSLKIDTSGLEKIGKSFNFSGVDKAAKNIQSQTQKVSKSLSQIMEQYKDLGKGFEIKGSTQQIQKQIDSLTNKLSNAKLAKDDFEASGKTNLGGYETAVKNVIKYTNQIESLKNQLAGLQTAQPKLDFSITGIEEAERKVSEVTEKIKTATIPRSTFNYNADAMKAVFGEVAAGIENWSQATQKFGANAGGVLNQATSKTDGLKERAEQFEQSLKNLQIPPINTDNINALQRELAKAESTVEKLRAKLANGITMGKITSSVDDKGFRNLRERMTLAEKTAGALRDKIKQVQQASTQTSAGAKKLGDSVSSASKSFSGLASSGARAIKPLSNLGNSFKSLLRTILPILGIRQLFNWGKQAMEISSDLTEVQNVVDTTFGNMAYKVEEFAETSIEKFGMSELALKQISSRFQAMGIAMGFPIDKMSDMSVELTGLAADMASFYNVSQEDVAKSLESIFTGTTRPMRQYGIDLTQATLREWALKNGLDANVQSMSQAEKTMLRYQYVMANTAAAHGDFARTSGTWANQVRILRQNFEQLASIVGGVLVNAFKPVISAVNAAMSAIIAFAKTISNALGKIFGWTYEEGEGGLAQDFGGAADRAGDLAGSTGKAAKNIKDMKAGLRAFDELKVINMPDSASGGGGGGGGASGGGDAATGDGGQWVQGESIFKNFESEIDNLYKLGKYIGDTLADALESIDWDSVYQKARNFGTGLALFLNGLISPRLFYDLGKTIAGGINTALNFLDSFGETFDWGNFGKSIGAGINGALENIDWRTALSSAKNWGTGIGEAINNFIETTDFSLVGETVANGLNAAIQLALSLGETIGFEEFVLAISDSINGFFETFDFGGLAEALNVWVDGILSAIKTAIENVSWEQVWDGIKAFFSKLKLDTKVVLAIAVAPAAISGLSNLVGILSKIGGAAEIAVDAFKIIKSSISPVSLAAGLVVAVLIDLWNTSEDFRKSVTDAFNKVKESLLNAFRKVTDAIFLLIEQIKELGKSFYDFYSSSPLKAVIELIATLAATLAGNAISIAIDVLADAFSGLVGVLSGAFEIISGVYNILTGIFTFDFEKIKEGFDKVGQGILKALESIFRTLGGAGGDIVQGLLDGIVDAMSSIGDWIKKKIFDPFIKGFKSIFGINSPSTVMKEQGGFIMQGLLDGIGSMVQKVVDSFTNIKNKILSVWENVKTKTSGVWSNIKSSISSASDSIKSTVSRTWDKIKGSVSSATDKIKTTTSNAWGALKQKTSETWSNLKTTISDAASTALSKASDKFGQIKSKVSTRMDEAKDAVKSAVEKIKGFFNFKWSLPKLKMPHFKMDGKFSLNPPQAPKLTVDWYAKGGLFNAANIIGVGEAGAEAVLPLTNQRTMGMIADSIFQNAEQAQSFGYDGDMEKTIYNAVYNATASAIRNEGGIKAEAIFRVEGDRAGLFKVIREESNAYFRRTGKPAYEF